MTEKKRAVFNWSGGKDSALALYKILHDERYEVVSLLTTVNRDSQRSTMHDIPLTLLKAQAASIGLPLYIVDITPRGGMIDYASALRSAVEHFQAEGVTHFVFGDIFLHDVRKYREQQLQPYAIEVVEPLWEMSSEEVMEAFLASGLQTVIVTITEGSVPETLIGRVIDRTLIEELPEGVDVCGENGEYHTFCFAGGMFKTPVAFRLGSPERRTFPVGLEDGTVKEFAYWFANLEA